MRAEELRIGNWYTSVKFGNSVQCELVDLYELCANSQGAFNNPPIDDMFKPIPTTKEWLKDFGFKVSYYGGQGNDGYTAKIKNMSLFSQKGDIYNWVIDGYSFVTIKYVHQLQNLYFALHEEELIKL